jgi:hypothetical protein
MDTSVGLWPHRSFWFLLSYGDHIMSSDETEIRQPDLSLNLTPQQRIMRRLIIAGSDHCRKDGSIGWFWLVPVSANWEYPPHGCIPSDKYSGLKEDPNGPDHSR